MTTVTFGGYELTEHFIVSDLVRSYLPRSSSMVKVDGRDGELFRSVSLDRLEISMTATYIGDPESRSDALRELARHLNTYEPTRLEISDDGGKYYLAIASGGSVERFIGAETVELVFEAPDPAMYGDTHTFPIPSGGVVHFEIGGNTWTHPVIEAEAVRDPDSLVWGVRLDDKDYIQVETGSAEARDIVCDCEKRTLTIDRSPALPTLTSDWLRFTPGVHKLENDNGTGSATVTFTERWL